MHTCIWIYGHTHTHTHTHTDTKPIKKNRSINEKLLLRITILIARPN